MTILMRIMPLLFVGALLASGIIAATIVKKKKPEGTLQDPKDTPIQVSIDEQVLTLIT